MSRIEKSAAESGNVPHRSQDGEARRSHHPKCAGDRGGRWPYVSASFGKLDCGRSTIYRWIEAGFLASKNTGRRMTRLCPGCIEAIKTSGIPADPAA